MKYVLKESTGEAKKKNTKKRNTNYAIQVRIHMSRFKIADRSTQKPKT